jgi:uncharacterized membrane protein YqjE
MPDQPNKEHFFEDFKNVIAEYLQNRLQLAKISVYEKIAKIFALVFSGIVLVILFFFTIVFMSLLAGFYFSEYYGSNFYGFGIVAAAYFILSLILLLFRKQLLEKFIINAVINILFKEKDETK